MVRAASSVISIGRPAYGMGAALLLLLAAASLGRVFGQANDAGEEPCFNQLQVLGSHNSYHQEPSGDLLAAFGGLATSGPLQAWQYSHPPLSRQLDAGVRALELDIYFDPEGGRFAQSAGLRLAGLNGWLTDARYQQPGFKVLHVPDFDYGTSCVLLSECLEEVRDWSDAHPGHLPIQLHLEVKGPGQVEAALGQPLTALLLDQLASSAAPGPSSLAEPPPTSAQLFRDLQAELEAAFGGGASAGGRLFTPDDARAAVGAPRGADLAALLAPPANASGAGVCPWPPLASMRGRVLPKLILYGGSTEADLLLQAYPNLEGSLAWVEQGDRRPLAHAAFRAVAVGRLSDDATALSLALPANADGMVAAMARDVAAAAAQGWMVRARCDADTVEARAEYTARRDALIAAGAHVVATDYERLPPAVQAFAGGAAAAPAGVDSAAAGPPPFNTSYSVALPGGQAGRCLSYCSCGDGGQLQTFAAAHAADSVYCGPLELGGGSGDASGRQGASSSVSPGAGAGSAPAPLEGTQQAAQSSSAAALGTAALLASAAAVAAALFV